MLNIGFIDISMILLIAVLSSLSKRLGEALKVSPYYKLYIVSIIIIAFAAFLDSVSFNTAIFDIPKISTLIIRVIAGILSLFVTYKYWHWLLAEINN